MADPLFSVVVPTCGRSELLPLAVASVLRQTVADLEVLVVDDGAGTTGTLPDDPRVRVLSRSERGGAAAARNTGIRAARGRYLTFLDDDDELTADRLALARHGLERAPVALSWKAGLGDGSLRWSRRLDGWVAGTLLEAPVPQLGSAAVQRDVALLLDESYPVSEDVEWWLRMSRVAPVHTVPEVGYLIRDHDGDRLRDRTSARLAARLRLLSAHPDYFAEHRRAAAYQWTRAGGLAEASGRPGTAVAAFARALRARPSAAGLGHVGRAGARQLLHRRGRH